MKDSTTQSTDMAGAAGCGSDLTPKTPIRICVMCQHDVDDVARLEKRCNSLPWTPSAYSTEVRNPSAYYIVAKDQQHNIIGYAGMWLIMDEAHITTIGVDPAARGRKVGEVLMNGLMQSAIEQGAMRATLEVRQSNTVAHKLYNKYGYCDVAMRKNYYSDNGENAIIMWADDLRNPAYPEMLLRYREQLSEHLDATYDFTRY